MLNELFTNAMKHAFVGHSSGKVTVSMCSDREGKLVLSIQDNGIGLPLDMDIETNPSLGLRLVQMLAKQLHATIDVKNNNGTTFTITFEVREP